MRALLVGGAVALAACNSLLDLDDVQYAEATSSGVGGAGASTGSGAAGGAAPGGGGAGGGDLDGEPQWLFHAAQAPGEQRVTDLAHEGERVVAVVLNRGTVPLAPLAPDSSAAAGANEQLLLSIDGAGALQRARSWGNDNDATTAEVASRDGATFVVGTYQGAGLDIGGSLPATCPAPCATADAYAVKVDRDLDPRWRASEGPAASDESGLAVAVQGGERVLLGGSFTAATELFGQSLTPAGDEDAYVVAIEDGDTLGWTSSWSWTTGSGAATARAMALAADDTSTAVLVDRPRAGGRDVTLHRLDEGGVETWPFPVAFAGSATPRAVTVSPVDGSVGVALALSDATDLPDGTTHTPAAGATLVLASYDTEQQERWFHLLEAESLGALEMATDAAGDLVVGVTFGGSFTLPDGTSLSATGTEAVAFKLDRGGQLLWHHPFGSPTSGDVEIRAVATRPDGSSYVAGSFRGTIGFDVEIATATAGDGADGRDAFVLLLAP